MLQRLLSAVSVAALLVGTVPVAPALAQSNPGWFVPPQSTAPAASPAPTGRHRRAVAQPAPPPAPMLEDQAGDPGPAPQDESQQAPLPNLPQPPAPPLPPIDKGVAPPVAVIGVLGVPDVMKQSNAAQIVDRVMGARKEQLQADVARAQATWKQMYQQLQADAPHLSAADGHAREVALRQRVDSDRRALQARNRIIQEAAQVSLSQIEATLVGIIKQVAASRGMNIVLHRSQVALNQPEFDITDEVTAQLNKVLPTVVVVPDGVDPATLPSDWNGAAPVAATTTAPVPAAQP